MIQATDEDHPAGHDNHADGSGAVETWGVGALDQGGEFLNIMNTAVADYPGGEIIVVFDSLSIHWPTSQSEICGGSSSRSGFHYTPTRASWLN